MPPVGFETTIASDVAAVDLRFRPRGHWDRHIINRLFSVTEVESVYCVVGTESLYRVIETSLST
jgi:hypothetical protein